jgi:hypothetical protein
MLSLYTMQMTEWLNNEGRWVDRYAWYNDWDSYYWEQTKLFAMTPAPTPTPGGPTPVINQSALGNFYSKVTPAAPIPLPWPTSRIYLPAFYGPS